MGHDVQAHTYSVANIHCLLAAAPMAIWRKRVRSRLHFSPASPSAEKVGERGQWLGELGDSQGDIVTPRMEGNFMALKLRKMRTSLCVRFYSF